MWPRVKHSNHLVLVIEIGKATMSKILAETSQAILQTLKDQFLKTPNCQNECLSISEGFEEKWVFPHCLGSLDGKHIRIECPRMSGTYYCNYKGFYSIVLWDICDKTTALHYLTWGNTGVTMTVVYLLGGDDGNDKFGIPTPFKLRSCSFDP